MRCFEDQAGRGTHTLFAWMSPHCSHSSRHAFANVFAQGPHLFRTKQAPVFAQKLAPSIAHSCWTHVRKQTVPTAFGTFFELASSSSKNVAADCKTGRFGGQRRMGTTRVQAASSIAPPLRTRCGHGPRCRHVRRWTTVHRMEPHSNGPASTLARLI